MRRLLVSFLALLCLGAFAATPCPDNKIRVLFVFTADAVEYARLNGDTPAQSINNQVSFANTILTSSGINQTIEIAGVRIGDCCGSATKFYTPNGEFSPNDFVETNIPIMQARDDANADQVVIIGNYINDAAGGAAYQDCTKAPFQMTSGINITTWYDGGAIEMAHEIAHTRCMNHGQGFVSRTGTTPQNCSVWWTAEFGNPPPNIITTTSACWREAPTGSTCYGSGHEAIVGFYTNRGVTCTYANGTLASPTSWTENSTCPNGGTSNWNIMSYGTTTSTFTCTNQMAITRFSNPNVLFNGVPTGDATHNAAATLNAWPSQYGCPRTKKIAPILKARAAAVLGVLQ